MPAALLQALYLAVLLGHQLAAHFEQSRSFLARALLCCAGASIQRCILVAEQPHTLSGLAAFGVVPVLPYSNSKDVREYVQVMEQLHTH